MDLIQPEQKLSINIEKDDKLVELLCTINKVYSDRLSIELPKYFMRYIECFDVGKPLTVKIFSKLGTIDFNTIILSSPLEEEFIVELDYNALKLTPNEDLQVINAIETIKLEKNNEIVTAKTLDISPEEIRISSTAPLELQENYNCELILPEDYGTIKFKATVISQDKIYDDEYKISCYAMSDDNRQTLLYYMYVYENEYETQD